MSIGMRERIVGTVLSLVAVTRDSPGRGVMTIVNFGLQGKMLGLTGAD